MIMVMIRRAREWDVTEDRVAAGSPNRSDHVTRTAKTSFVAGRGYAFPRHPVVMVGRSLEIG